MTLRNLYASFLVAFLYPFSTASAYDFSAVNVDGVTLYYNIIDDGTAEVTYAQRHKPTMGYSGQISVPSVVSDGSRSYTVAAVGLRAFAFCDCISSISLPVSVVMIGANAFDGCYGLESVTIDGAGHLTADGRAYYDRNTLVAYAPGVMGRYDVAAGTTHIAPAAFGGCTFLTEVSLPDGLQSVGDNAFYFCNYLERVDIPASVTEIGNSAFSDCLSLEAINVDAANSVYSSVDGTLLDHSGALLIQSPGAQIGAANVPDGVTKVGEEAFFRSYGITTVKLPPSVTEIGEGAFIDCPRLASVEIPSSVKNIGTLAFALCPELKSLYVDADSPESISLGDGVFADIDHNLCSLYVPTGSESLYASAPQWGEFRQIKGTNGLQPQVIEWLQAADSVKVDTSIPLNAVASSKLTVEYLLAPSCRHLASIVDGQLKIQFPGQITVTAYQPGNVVYAPAEPVTHTYFASVAGITDALADASNVKVYGTDGMIVIKGADDESVATVFDISGRMIYQGIDRSIPVPSRSIYVVVLGNNSFKVITR